MLRGSGDTPLTRLTRSSRRSGIASTHQFSMDQDDRSTGFDKSVSLPGDRRLQIRVIHANETTFIIARLMKNYLYDFEG